MCRFASLSFSLGPFFEQGWAIRPVDMDGWVGGLGGNRECSKVKKTRCIIPTPVTAMEWVCLFFRLLYLFHCQLCLKVVVS